MDQQLLLRKFGRCDEALVARLRARADSEGEAKLLAEIGAMPDHIAAADEPTRLQRRLSAIEARLDALEGGKAGAPPPAPETRFTPEFIAAERLADETDAAADERLLAEYADLEARRPLSFDDENRRVTLHRNFYEYRG